MSGNEEQVTVVFTVVKGNKEALETWLQHVTEDASGFITANFGNPALGYRADDTVQRREALQKFVDRMELVLRAHDGKTSWRERPIEALIRLLKLEMHEFDVAHEFFEISEARKELIDIANYCLICDDRLSLLDQNKPLREQET